MEDAPLSQPGSESPGYYVPAADASTQTTEEDFIFLEPTRDASSQTTEEDFILSEPFQGASTQTTEDDFELLSRIQSTINISIPISESIVDTSNTVQFENPIDMQSVDVRDEKVFVCQVCDKDLKEHAETRIKSNFRKYKLYLCCVCSYTTCKSASLTRHIDIHRAKNICNICTREYTEGDPHSTENTCNVCKKEFQCKTFLDQHCAVAHEQHFMTHCWICGSRIDEHLNIFDGITHYVCCACGIATNDKSSGRHNNTHSPKLFCIRCKEEYPINEKDCHSKEFKCIVCQVTFQCLTFLETHFQVHNDFLSSHCIFCPDMLNLHKKECWFQCCVCSKSLPKEVYLQRHLLTHTRLRLFKCADCGQRYTLKFSLKEHSKKCIPLPFKCEKCRARFPSRDSLKLHCLKKH